MTFKKCTAGKFCPEKSFDETKSPVKDCDKGFYCPEATPTMVPCEPGRACTAVKLAASDKDCAAGWYCKSGASLDKPTLPKEGGKCPKGHICPVKS